MVFGTFKKNCLKADSRLLDILGTTILDKLSKGFSARNLPACEKFSQLQVATEYNVGQSTIAGIKSKKTQLNNMPSQLVQKRESTVGKRSIVLMM